ncbi:MAG: flagellar basal body P-ring formation chaperone FlgA [Gammaproteobacteria bacterium]|nr:flagellar basal body P-ring formation chaperone FlgA [Gammaproteobacteria bacterium]
MKPITLILFLLLGPLPLSLHASSYHDMSTLNNLVTDFLYNLPDIKRNNNTQIKVHAIDRRLKLSKCNKVTLNLATGSQLLGKTSIRVICKQPKAWSLYVTAMISRYDDIYLSNGSFNRGHIIRQNDVYKSRKDLAKLPFGYITNPVDIIGKQFKRHVQPGRIITPSQLSNPVVIKRGDIIALQSKTNGFRVSMKGSAMTDGAIGDRIRVKNSSSKRIVEGRVTRSGVVEIGN